MVKILFICHGNICRSPMAEFVFKDMIQKEGLSSVCKIASAATSREEIGNDIHIGTKRKLQAEGIPFEQRRAVQMTALDCKEYDFLIGMDNRNIENIKRMAGEEQESKIHMLLEFAGLQRGIADPWYTGNFEETYHDIFIGCNALFNYLRQNKMLD